MSVSPWPSLTQERLVEWGRGGDVSVGIHLCFSEAKGDQRRPEVWAGRVSLRWVGSLALEPEQVIWYLSSS